MSTLSKALTFFSLVTLSSVQAQQLPAPELPVDSLEMVDLQTDSLVASQDTLEWTPQCWGQALARAAQESADSYREKPGQRLCYRYVKQAVSQALGLTLTGPSAYLAARQLATSEHFQEMPLRSDQLSSLPAGSIVVWGRSKQHPHGHVSIADGKGHEISDRLRPQITNYGTSLRVFVPECEGFSPPAPR